MMMMKNFNDTIGIRPGDIPACSAVPQPTAPPRIPKLRVAKRKVKRMHLCMLYGVESEQLAA